ncbi:MAG: TetR/AcrR family transcriptional regulator [Myxococcota bacterium]
MPDPDPASTPKTARFERRRLEILAVAEAVFGESGLAGARLEEVARRLGMRRPSLLYYFADKDALYDAVFADILDALRSHIETARSADDPMARMEAIASAWVDFLSGRPWAARILLRQIADELPARSSSVRARSEQILASVREEIEEGVELGLFKPIDAGVFATAIAGTSMFWVTARRVVERSLAFDPLAPESLERFREVLVLLTRQMLGAGDGPSERSRS